MKVVIDTNVFISGIFWKRNYSSKIIKMWMKKGFELISSKEIIDEFERTMNNFKIQMPDKMIMEWKNLILKHAVIVNPTIKLNVVKDDLDDNKFIEAAITGKATLIISQDKHLLNIKKYKQVTIINPKEAIKELEILSILKKANEQGLLLDEKEMKKYGFKS
ncbi:MAG: putative toxin-antitoxin system toxin component, PIN family [archaeon]